MSVAIERRLRTASIAWFFLAIGCYTMLAPIDGPVAVGSAVLPRSAAIVLAATIVLAGLGAALAAWRGWQSASLATSRRTLLWWAGALIIPAALGFAPARGFAMIGLAALAAAEHLAIVRWWAAPGTAPVVRRTILIGGTLLALTALAMQVAHRPMGVYAANLGRATGLFVTPNQFAAWLITFTALATGIALAAAGRERILAIGAAATGALALCATFSLGGWLGGATAFVVGAWWLGRRRLAASAVLVALGIGLAAALFPGLTHHHASERFVRFEAIGAGLHEAALFPLLGVGPLAYPMVYDAMRVPQSTADTIVREHPHDLTISLLCETGIAGVAAILIGWLTIGRAIRAGYHRADEPSRRLVVCVCAGLIGRFAHGLVDLVGVLELAFVWIPFSALALAVVRSGWNGDEGAA